MKIINELYILPDNDFYILYAPLLRVILSVNADVVVLLMNIKEGRQLNSDENSLSVIDYLKTIGIIDSGDTYPSIPNSNDEYTPTNVTFLPTSDCNLNCIYCYANSGIKSKYLTIDIAKSALDFIFNNAKKKKFHVYKLDFSVAVNHF